VTFINFRAAGLKDDGVEIRKATVKVIKVTDIRQII